MIGNSPKTSLTTHLKRVLQGTVKASGRTEFEPTGSDTIDDIFAKLVALLQAETSTGSSLPAHTHLIAEVVGLQQALAGKASTQQLAAAIADVENSLGQHTHTVSQITDFPVAMPPTAHGHPTSEVTGLDAALAGKQPLATLLTALAALANAAGVLTNDGAGNLSWGAGGGGGGGGVGEAIFLFRNFH